MYAKDVPKVAFELFQLVPVTGLTANFSLSEQVNRCLSIKGAEDVLNKPHAFEISTVENSMFFIADSDKVNACCGSCCIIVIVVLGLC